MSEGVGPRIEARALDLALPGADDALPVLSRMDLAAAPGEFLCLVGPSGCGKTTLLECLAGLRTPDAGEVLVDGKPAEAGRLALMPQRDSLLPWRTVHENVAWGAALAGMPTAEGSERTAALIRRVGLAGFEDHFPHALSGGMRQRAALARTLLSASRGWLLDEPFGALDAITRADLHALLTGLLDHQPTIVMVTHDLDEALDLADRTLVLSGRPARPVRELAITAPRAARRSPGWATERARIRQELVAALGGVGAAA